MHRIEFAASKHPILTFEAEDISFAQEQGGVLLTANGSIVFQDTPLVEAMVAGDERVHVTLYKSDEVVLAQQFSVTVFALEPETLAVLLGA